MENLLVLGAPSQHVTKVLGVSSSAIRPRVALPYLTGTEKALCVILSLLLFFVTENCIPARPRPNMHNDKRAGPSGTRMRVATNERDRPRRGRTSVGAPT